jgi:hypothetical protein
VPAEVSVHGGVALKPDELFVLILIVLCAVVVAGMSIHSRRVAARKAGSTSGEGQRRAPAAPDADAGAS